MLALKYTRLSSIAIIVLKKKITFEKNTIETMKKLSIGILFLLFSINYQVFAQISGQANFNRIAFYNVENFFDIYPDTVLGYNQFTPNGDHHWNKNRYATKKNHIYKVIAALGGWQGVSIMGFAEIENRSILEDLTQKTPLKKEHYKIVHFESHDHRGIDVGLIYRPDRFKVLHAHKIPVIDSNDTNFHTRDILYVKGLLQGDTLNIFVNHWPSRYGGLMRTIPKRKLAAHVLKKIIDSVFHQNKMANILVMGDFNDRPDDESIQILERGASPFRLYPLTYKTLFNLSQGSLKHKTEWAVFDQILVSDALKRGRQKLQISNNSFIIFDAAFLLEKDEKYQGMTTDRTYKGFTYHGGFSDHLPVYVDIVKSISR